LKRFILLFLILLVFQSKSHGQTFNSRIQGHGKPTIVIEVAMGENLETWKRLQQKLSAISEVVTYDRLGLGRSDSTNHPRTIENLTNDLDKFLTNEKIETPYILIGHSLGSFIARKYQSEYPQNVAGMILIDPVHEYQFDSLMALKTNEEKKKAEEDRERFVNSLPKGQRNEAFQYHQQRNTMKNVKFPTDIPITIIATFRVGQGATKEDREIKKRLIEYWMKDAPQIKLISTFKSGHYIQDSEPELLIDEVELMVNSLRKK